MRLQYKLFPLLTFLRFLLLSILEVSSPVFLLSFRFLPPDQLAVHLRKAKEEMKKKRREEEQVWKSFRKVIKAKESRKEEE